MAKTKTVLLENLDFDDMENLSNFDSHTLAAALVFVVVELMAMDRDTTSVPAEELLSQASAHALDLLEGVHVLTNDLTTGEETLH